MTLADNVSIFPGETTEEFDPNVMLGAAARANLQSVVIIGWDEDDNLFFSTSLKSNPEMLWLLKVDEKALLETGEE